MIELHFNDTVLQVQEDESSFCYNSIGLEQSMTLKFSVAEPLDIPVGAWCVFNGVEYTLLKPNDITKSGTRNITYSILLNGPFAKSGHYKVRNTVDRRLKFSMCARPKEFLQLIVDNLNMRDGGWSVGTCIESTEKTIEFNHVFIADALQNIINEFDTEGEVVGKVISLGKVEYFKDDPLPLSYGKGNGFKPGVGRMNTDDDHPVEILFVQGGNRNIDASKYGSADLLLPAGQELEYEGRVYVVDEDGYSIRRKDKAIRFGFEDSFDGGEIYPSRVGTVSSVVEVDAANNFYDIVDDSIPDSLNYRDCRIAGETMTIIFQSGMLAGREFEIQQTEDALTGYDPSKKKFELVPTEIDGITMPGGVYVPRPGDTYAVFGCMLPKAYIRDDETKSGASWDLFREAARYMYEHEDFRFTFTGELQALWTKRNWLRVGGRLRIGSYIRFSDVAFVPDGVDIRITGIKTYLNAPYSPTIEISNNVSGSRVNSALKKAENAEVAIEDKYRDAIQFTKRRFRDSKETIAMLEDALLENFSSSITPLSVQTMAMLIGDESLQYRFVKSMENPTVVPHNVSYDSEKRVLTVPAGIIQHMTLGISTLSSSHKVSEYRFWSLGGYVSPVLDVAEKKYYLYAKVGSTSKAGEFLLSEKAIGMKEVSGYYHLLVGVLNSEYDGVRSYVSLYGFSEVLPGRITTDRVVSGDGESFLDLLNNALKLHDKLQYNVNGDGQLKLKGTIIQNEGGYESVLGVYRGVYSDAMTYFPDDRVQYGTGRLVSTYTYINKTPGKGHKPTDPLYWRVDAAGVKGTDGDFYEHRYQKNGSTSVAPGLAKNDLIPAGWTTVMPAVGALEYLWFTTAKKSGDGETLLTEWSTPVRITPYDGKNGAKGENPVVLYRGVYDSTRTYYGTKYRLDAVKYNGVHYITRIDAGEFHGVDPTNTAKWNPFGAELESIATNLLLAEGANIGDWFMSGGKIVSTLEAGNKITLDAKNAKILIEALETTGLETGIGSTINLEARNGIVEVRSKSGREVSYMSPNGIFANKAGTQCITLSSGFIHRAAIAGLGFANQSKSTWDTDAEQNLVAGVYGTASNSGDAPSFGGVFYNLFAIGLILKRKAITDKANTSYDYLYDGDTLVIGYNSKARTVYLPLATKEGQTVIFKQWWSGSMRVYPRSGQKLYDDNTANDYYDVTTGQMMIAVFTIGYINGVKTEAWLVSKFKF